MGKNRNNGGATIADAVDVETLVQLETLAGAASPEKGTLRLADLLGEPTFERPDRTFTTKDKKSVMVARMIVPVAGLLKFEATVWMRSTESEGYIEREITIGLQRGIGIVSNIVDGAEQLQDWKNSILQDGGQLDAFLFPQGAENAPRTGDGAKLVKRVAIKK